MKTSHEFRCVFMYYWCLALTITLGPLNAIASFEASPNTVFHPDGPGSIQGMGESFQVSPATGSVTYDVSISVPPGTRRFEPKLKLSYASIYPNSSIGVGWKIEPPRICRKTDAGQPVYGGALEGDGFYLEYAGDIVPVEEWNGWWALRIEGEFYRFYPEQTNGGWLVQSPDGKTLYYGSDLQSREGPRPEAFSGTYCWGLTKVSDPWDRAIDYRYKRDQGRIYLKEITYGPREKKRSVVFAYETRYDRLSDWRAGYARIFGLRLARVATRVGARQLKTWRFSYTEDWNASRLTTITVSGENGEKLPSHSFFYNTFAKDRVQIIPVEGMISGIDWTSSAVRLFDVNGDALPDVLDTRTWTVFLNIDGTQLASDGLEIPAEWRPDFWGDKREWTLADVDGDGLQDIIARRSIGSLETNWYRNISDASTARLGFDAARILDAAIHVGLSSGSLAIIDTNLDKRPDFIDTKFGYVRGSVTEVSREVDGRVLSSSRVRYDTWQPNSGAGVGNLNEIDFSMPGHLFADMNGDQLTDIVKIVRDSDSIYGIGFFPSTGKGRFGDWFELQQIPDGLLNANPDRLRIADINTDGLADAVEVWGSYIRYWLNIGGKGFSNTYAVEVDLNFKQNVDFAVVDFNGNGSMDILLMDPDEGWTVVELLGDEPIGLLKRAENGLGGGREFDYVSTTEARKEAFLKGTPWDHVSPLPLFAVAEERRYNGIGHLEIRNFVYRDPYWNTKLAQFHGFMSSTEYLRGDEYSETQVIDRIYYVGHDMETAGYGGFWGEPVESFPLDTVGLRGLIRSSVHRRESGEMIEQTVKRYSLIDLPSHRYMIRMTGVAKLQAEGIIAAPKPGSIATPFNWPKISLRFPEQKEEERLYSVVEHELDNWGNPVRSLQWGYVERTNCSDLEICKPWRDIPGDELFIEKDYIIDVDKWRIGRVYGDRIVDRGGETLQGKRTYFDGLSQLGDIEKGLPTVVEKYLDSEKKWVRTAINVFDEHGNRIESLDALGHRTTLVYDDEVHAFPVSEKNYLNQGAYAENRTQGSPDFLEAKAEYDLDRGLTTAVTDFSGATTLYGYDGLDRITYKAKPGDDATDPTFRYNYKLADPLSYIETITKLDTEGRSIVERKLFDGLGYLFVKATFDSVEKEWIVSEFNEKSATGKSAREYRNFRTELLDEFTLPRADTVYSEYQYDALGRLTVKVDAQTRTEMNKYRAGARWYFDGNDTDLNSPNWYTPTIDINDGLGRNVSHTESLVKDDALVFLSYRYKYDGSGQISSVTLPDGTQRYWSYDSFGQPTRVNDPNGGTRQRVYDLVGNLLRQVDAEGNVVKHEFDAIGRLVSVGHRTSNRSSDEIQARYRYDVSPEGFTSENSFGHLTARYEGIDTFLSYTPRGLVKETQRRVDGKAYTMRFEYNNADQTTNTEYADGTNIEQRFDHLGRLVGILGVVDKLRYDDMGHAVEKRLHNQVVETTEYNALLQPVRLRIRDGEGADLLDMTRSFDVASNLLKLVDHTIPNGNRSQSITLFNDALGRPLIAETSDDTKTSYGYNTANSLSFRDVKNGSSAYDAVRNGTFDFIADRPHLVETVAGSSFEYDKNGSLLRETHDNGETRQYDWDAAGRLRSVTLNDGRHIGMVYDGGFQRQIRTSWDEKGSQTEKTIYLSKHDRLEKKDGRTTYIKFIHTGLFQTAQLYTYRDPGFDLEFSGTGVVSLDQRESVGGMSFGFLLDYTPLISLIGFIFVGGLIVFVSRKFKVTRIIPVWQRTVAMSMVTMMIVQLGGCNERMEPSGNPDHELTQTSRQTRVADRIAYIHTDFRGTQLLVTDELGQELSRSVASTYGVLIHKDARPENTIAEEIAHRSLFTGKARDKDTGLLYFGVRHYDPSIGRWLNADPAYLWGVPQDSDSGNDKNIFLNGNLFTFGGNQPWAYVDPDGQGLIAVMLIAAAVGAAIGFIANSVAAGREGKDFGTCMLAGLDGAIGGGIGGFFEPLPIMGNIISNVLSTSITGALDNATGARVHNNLDDEILFSFGAGIVFPMINSAGKTLVKGGKFTNHLKDAYRLTQEALEKTDGFWKSLGGKIGGWAFKEGAKEGARQMKDVSYSFEIPSFLSPGSPGCKGVPWCIWRYY